MHTNRRAERYIEYLEMLQDGWNLIDFIHVGGKSLRFDNHKFPTSSGSDEESVISTIRTLSGWDSSVGIATRYGLDGPGIESRGGGEIFRTRTDRPWGPPCLLYNGYRVFTGGQAAGAWC